MEQAGGRVIAVPLDSEGELSYTRHLVRLDLLEKRSR